MHQSTYPHAPCICVLHVCAMMQPPLRGNCLKTEGEIPTERSSARGVRANTAYEAGSHFQLARHRQSVRLWGAVGVRNTK
eukprot:5701495-Pyramimonas_sp.AAC.1